MKPRWGSSLPPGTRHDPRFTFHAMIARWWLLLIVAAGLVFRLALALALPYDGGTDERRRYPTTVYLYQHGRVPRYGDGTVEAQGFTARPVLPVRLAALLAHAVPDPLPLLVKLRLSAVLLGVLTVTLAYGCVRRLWPQDPPLAVAAAAIAAFHPQFLYVGSYLNDDAYTVAANTLLVFLLAVVHRRGARLNLGTAAALGGTLGVIFLGRQNGYVGFLLAAGYGLSLLRADWRVNRAMLAVSLAVFLAFPTAFYLHQYLRLGIAYVPLAVGSGVAWVPPGWSVADAFAQLAPAGGLDYPIVRARWVDPLHWFLYLSALLPSSFGVFGYMDVFLPSPLYSWYLVFLLAGVAGVLRWLRRIRRAGDPVDSSRRWLLGSCAAAVAAMLLVVTYHNFTVLYQPQGRYLLPVLAPALLLLLLGWRELRLPPPLHRAVPLLAAVLFTFSGTYATGFLLARAI